MTKRPNPYGEESPLQFKTHISVKELDRGVGEAVRMRAVHEKTRALLYEGARSCSRPTTPTRQDSEGMDMEEVGCGEPVPQSGQLRLDSLDGQLHLDSNAVMIIDDKSPVCDMV